MHLVPLTELDDEHFESALGVQQRAELAADPDVAPITGPELRRWAVHDRTEGNRHERLAVIDGTRVRAVVHLELETDEANRHRANVEVFGAVWDIDAATIGLVGALDMAEAEGRRVITGWGPNTAEEDRFWTGVGATLSFRERRSALDVTTVDADLMDAWIADGVRRAPDVQLVRWVDRCPEDHLAPWIESQLVMNDTPHDGLDVNSWALDEDDVRNDEATARDLGLRVMSVLAVDALGRAVGHTRLAVIPERPMASRQWDTAVVDRHRGRGVGKWIKAEMWRWLRADEPAVTRLTAGNAESNDAMLAINVAMGYVPIAEYGAWQAPIEAMRGTLSRP